MKKLSVIILCLVIGIGILAGCGAKPQTQPQGSGNEEVQLFRKQISGTWEQVADPGSVALPDMGIPSGYVFYLDGTGIDTFWDMTFTYSVNGDKLHIAYDDSIGEDWDYFFEIQGDKLSLTRVDDGAITMTYQRQKEEAETETETETETEAETEATEEQPETEAEATP